MARVEGSSQNGWLAKETAVLLSGAKAAFRLIHPGTKETVERELGFKGFLYYRVQSGADEQSERPHHRSGHEYGRCNEHHGPCRYEQVARRVLAPNGKIYGISANDTRVLIIDPSWNTVDTASITGLTGSFKWVYGVLAPNGKIYAAPHEDGRVLIIDPATNTADVTSITGLSGTSKWVGGVLAPNGKIYGIPHQDTRMLIIDPKASGSFCSALMLSGYFNKL